MSKNKTNINPVGFVWTSLIFSIISGSIGWLYYNMNPYINNTYYYGESSPIEMYIISIILFLLSFISFCVFIKKIIEESNVRALEIFHGKERAVKN